VGLSYSNYTTRDYSLVFPATVILRDLPVGVNDTIESRGGINDLQLAVACRPVPRVVIGLGAHILTGINRLDVHRVFSDSAYLPSRQRSELSFAGFGMSLGILGQLTRSLSLGLLARSDGHVSIQEDSLPTQERVDLPITLGAALRWRPSGKFQMAGQVLKHNWSSANDDIIANGGVGAVNTSRPRSDSSSRPTRGGPSAGPSGSASGTRSSRSHSPPAPMPRSTASPWGPATRSPRIAPPSTSRWSAPGAARTTSSTSGPGS
jgi:hypothetical protein